MTTQRHSNFNTAWLAVALLAGSIAAHAGDEITSSKDNKVPLTLETSPLCFGPFCFDIEERVRVEAQQNSYTFSNSVHSPANGTWLQNRFRLGVAWQPVSWFKAYAQGQSSLEAFAQRSTVPGLSGAEGNDPYNLHQAYVEIGDPKEFPLVLKVGRQELIYGDQRLVGNFDWNNFGRTFDAVKLSLVQPHWQLDLFASSVVVIQRDRFDKSDLFNGNNNDRDQIFSGLYFTAKDLSFGTLDLYSFWLSESSGTVANVESAVATARPLTGSMSKESSFGTYGGRLFGDPAKLNGWEFNVEGAYQSGTVRGLDLDAFAVHAGAGYNFKLPWNPRLFVEYNYASGDSNPKDGGIQTFQNLFPTNHGLYGIMDNFAWQNMSSPAISLSVKPVESVTLKVAFYGFWLANTNDSWYRANGLTTERPLNAAAEKANSFAGTELDFVANWKVTKNLSLEAGYSHFFAGTYLENTGAADDANFGYAMAKIKF